MSPYIFIMVVTLYATKMVVHFIYLSRADRLMGRNESMGFFAAQFRYLVILTPVFLKDGIAEHKFDKEMKIICSLSRWIFGLLVLATLSFFVAVCIEIKAPPWSSVKRSVPTTRGVVIRGTVGLIVSLLITYQFLLFSIEKWTGSELLVNVVAALFPLITLITFSNYRLLENLKQ